MKGKLLLIALLCSHFIYAQYDNAGSYITAIGEQYRIIQKEMWEYTSAASHGKSAKTVEKKRLELVQTTYEAKGKVMRMKDFKGNTTYRDSVVAFLDMYYHVIKEDYGKIVNMEEIAERSYDNMEAYMMAKEEANNKLNDASEMLIQVEKDFAAEFDVELMSGEEDELSRKMGIASEVYDYYNKLYLIFFKGYIADKYLSEAITNQDVNAIEQNRQSLSSSAAEGLEKLKDIKAYNGDNTVAEALKQMLDFYQKEADEMVEHITNYFIKAENFQTIKKSFDAKKEKDRTQADVDQFNNAVNESNAAGQKYNETNQEMFNTKNKLIENWNKSVEKFLDKHVPK
ncbi:MAG: hypothetical protein R2780_00340 [Crocinitomicaceae bacterium]|nr:hypothetical protein [Crocinitomicaceae bacterium]